MRRLACLAVLAAPATAHARVDTYATCYQLKGRMANGKLVHRRAAASNVLRLGTRIRLTGHAGPGGVRRYVISDTGRALSDGHLDLWAPNCAGWPNPRVTYKIGWGR